jgi:hypothetical protein
MDDHNHTIPETETTSNNDDLTNSPKQQKGPQSDHIEITASADHLSAAAISRELSESRILKRRIVDFSSGEEDYVPTHQRLTQKGGYIHTKSTRLKISQANSGNVPWNKGKNRSSDAKAKISAGVKARNHAILITKLEKLGMTEDEWHESRRKIKLLREKVRKARSNAAKELEGRDHRRKQRQEQEEQYRALRKRYRVLYDSEDEVNQKKRSTNDDDSENLSEPEVPSDVEITTKQDTMNENKNDDTMNVNKNDDKDEKHVKRIADDANNETIADEQPPSMPSIFVRDVCWTPHPLDSKAVSYKELCPHGGPGGLICCDICAANYTKFLSRSYTNIEKQKIAKVGTELNDLLDISEQIKLTLAQSIYVARTKPVPHRATRADGNGMFYEPDRKGDSKTT